MTLLSGWLLIIALVVIALQSILHVMQLRYEREYQLESSGGHRRINYTSQIVRDSAIKKDVIMFGMDKFVLGKIESFQKLMLVISKAPYPYFRGY